MTTTKEAAPVTVHTLESLVELTVKRSSGSGTDDQKYRLEKANYRDRNAGRKWTLVASGQQYSRHRYDLAVTDELGALLEPLFPPHFAVQKGYYAGGTYHPAVTSTYPDPSRTWLTLVGIMKRLNKTEVTARIKAAQDTARRVEAAAQKMRVQRDLSDAVEACKSKLEHAVLSNLADLGPALNIVQMAHNALVEALKALEYPEKYPAGTSVEVPAPEHRYRSGVVLGQKGRTIRVDVKMEDGTAVVKEFDASQVRERR